VNIAEQEVGTLVRLDQIYDLVEGNISSEVRAKITAIPKKMDHPLAQPVAKAICLLQYAKSIHRSTENIAASLHPAVAADAQLAAVKEALRQLEAAHEVRHGDDGYRIGSGCATGSTRGPATRIGSTQRSSRPSGSHSRHTRWRERRRSRQGSRSRAGTPKKVT
jgi:hypothetical protein